MSSQGVLVRFERDNSEDEEIAKANFPNLGKQEGLVSQFLLELHEAGFLKEIEKFKYTDEKLFLWVRFEKTPNLCKEIQKICFDEAAMSGFFEIESLWCF